MGNCLSCKRSQITSQEKEIIIDNEGYTKTIQKPDQLGPSVNPMILRPPVDGSNYKQGVETIFSSNSKKPNNNNPEISYSPSSFVDPRSYSQTSRRRQYHTQEVSYNKETHKCFTHRLQQTKVWNENFADPEFRQLLFENHLALIEFIEENQKKFKYIAEHTLGKVEKSQQQFVAFDTIIEKGGQDFLGTSEKLLLLLTQKQQAFYWVECLAFIIQQLQQAGLFHLDLGLDNTIKVLLEKGFIYKLIDFDCAFKVKEGSQMTKQIIEYCVLNKQYKQLIRYMFKGPEYSHSGGKYCNTFNSLMDAVKDETSRIDIIADLLAEFSVISHRRQFKQQLELVLKKFLNQPQLQEIKSLIDAIEVTTCDNYQGYKKVIDRLKTYSCP